MYIKLATQVALEGHPRAMGEICTLHFKRTQATDEERDALWSRIQATGDGMAMWEYCYHHLRTHQQQLQKEWLEKAWNEDGLPEALYLMASHYPDDTTAEGAAKLGYPDACLWYGQTGAIPERREYYLSLGAAQGHSGCIRVLCEHLFRWAGPGWARAATILTSPWTTCGLVRDNLMSRRRPDILRWTKDRRSWRIRELYVYGGYYAEQRTQQGTLDKYANEQPDRVVFTKARALLKRQDETIGLFQLVRQRAQQATIALWRVLRMHLQSPRDIALMLCKNAVWASRLTQTEVWVQELPLDNAKNDQMNPNIDL
jgi:hypothetical protein